MLAQAEAGNFLKKNFENCGKSFNSTSYLHFTTSIGSTTKPEQKLEFTCILCTEHFPKFLVSLDRTSDINCLI
jgi:hypothetical protein